MARRPSRPPFRSEKVPLMLEDVPIGSGHGGNEVRGDDVGTVHLPHGERA